MLSFRCGVCDINVDWPRFEAQPPKACPHRALRLRHADEPDEEVDLLGLPAGGLRRYPPTQVDDLFSVEVHVPDTPWGAATLMLLVDGDTLRPGPGGKRSHGSDVSAQVSHLGALRWLHGLEQSGAWIGARIAGNPLVLSTIEGIVSSGFGDQRVVIPRAATELMDRVSNLRAREWSRSATVPLDIRSTGIRW